jgi:hypothetical protein
VTSREAKRILAAHRPGRETGQYSEVAAALEQAWRDPALQQWWKQQQAFHAAMDRGFAQMPVPGGLREQVLARAKTLPFPWWRRPTAWAAAAGIVLLIGLAALLWRPATPEGTFQTFRSRMVRSVLRQYRMDIRTNDMASIREFLATKNAPADYVLPPGLTKLPPSGAGVLSWKSSRVSMVCLDSGKQGTLFVFIADRSELQQPPTAAREFAQVNKLMTVSWSEAGKVYVLAGEGGREILEKYF